MTRLILVVLFLITLAVVAFMSLAPVTLPGGLTLSFGAGAASILRELAPDETLWREAGEIETRPGDGPAPEMARRSYRLEAPAAALRSALDATCAEAGFAPPQTPAREGESDLICTGQRRGDQINVYLFVECEEPACRAGLWVHVF